MLDKLCIHYSVEYMGGRMEEPIKCKKGFSPCQDGLGEGCDSYDYYILRSECDDMLRVSS